MHCNILGNLYPTNFKTSTGLTRSNEINNLPRTDPRDSITKKCTVRLAPLSLDVKQILNMEDSEKSKENKEQHKRDNEGYTDGPVIKKSKNSDIVLLEGESKSSDKIVKPPVPDVTVIKVKTGLGGSSKDGCVKEKKSSSADHSPSDKLKSSSSLQRTSSFDSNRKPDKEKMSKSSSSLSASSSSNPSSSSCTLDKTDRTSLNCLEQKLLELQKATQKTKPSGDNQFLSSKPKSMSPSGLKPSKDSHHRRKEDFITDRKKHNSSPKKLMKKSASLSSVKDSKMPGNLFCPTTDAKVTILPINKPNAKDMDHKPPTTSNSVTITKISNGDSLNVPSKDIKRVFSPKSKTSPDSSKTKFSLKNFSKGEKHRSSDKHKDHRNRDKEYREKSRESSRESRDGKEQKEKHNYCSKCNEQFSTKEAKKLHTCNSILDAHYLIDERDRQKTSPTSSVSESGSTSLSRSSSRSSSPGLPGVSNKKSNPETPPKLKLSVKNESSDSGKVKFSLKKDDHDEKVKKPSSFGIKRDSPKEKWVESKSSFKSDNISDGSKDSHRDTDDLSKSRTSGIVIEPMKLNSDKLFKTTGDEVRNKDEMMFPARSDSEFSFTGKRTYSPSMGDAISVDGKGICLYLWCSN